MRLHIPDCTQGHTHAVYCCRCPAAIYQSPASQAGQHVTRICGVYFDLWESFTQSSDIMISPCVIVKWYHSMHLPMVMVLKVATYPIEEVASSGQNVLSRHPHVSSQQVWRSCCWRNHTLFNGIRVICCTAICLHTHIRWVMSGKKKMLFGYPGACSKFWHLLSKKALQCGNNASFKS